MVVLLELWNHGFWRLRMNANLCKPQYSFVARRFAADWLPIPYLVLSSIFVSAVWCRVGARGTWSGKVSTHLRPTILTNSYCVHAQIAIDRTRIDWLLSLTLIVGLFGGDSCTVRYRWHFKFIAFPMTNRFIHERYCQTYLSLVRHLVDCFIGCCEKGMWWALFRKNEATVSFKWDNHCPGSKSMANNTIYI